MGVGWAGVLERAMKKVFRMDANNRDVVTNSLNAFLEMITLDRTISITISDAKQTRSQQQNRFYWEIVGIISNDTGYERTEMHDILRYKLLGMKTKEVSGHEYEVLPSTTELSVGEMAEYITGVIRFAAGLGVRLPAMEF